LFIKYKIIFNKVPNFNRYPYENLNLTQQKTFQKNLKKLYLLSKKYKFIPVITVYSIGVSKTTHNYIKQEVLKNKIIFLDISNELGIGSIAKFREKTLQIDPHPNITTHNEIAKFLYKKLNLNLIKKD
jgi:hypothetical protein